MRSSNYTLLITCFLFSSTAAQSTTHGNTLYRLSAPATYIVLSGDLVVKYEVPSTSPVLRLKLIELVEGAEQTLVKMDVPINTTSGEIRFPCGLVERAGQTVFKLVTVYEDSVLATTDRINVQWPAVRVHVPLLVDTYSSDVIVQLYLGTLKCGPRPRGSYSTFVELVYEGPSPVSTWHKTNVLFSKELAGWLMETSHDVLLDCEFFDKAGYYRVRVRTDVKSTPLVAESDLMHVMWSPLYSVSVAKSSVLPCDGSLSVIYHYPRCILDQDRIRVYGRASRGRSNPLKYLLESRIQSGKHSTKLSCELFGDDFQEYCFSFVSTARNGAVFDLDTECVPRQTEEGSSEVQWSEWSSWSECSLSCGTGVQSRYRLCDSYSKDAQCEGKSVQSQSCNAEPCPVNLTATTQEPNLLPTECSCGCELNLTDKYLIDVGQSDCQSESLWVIQTSPPSHIILDFQKLLLPSPDHWLTVRDGKSSLGPVIATIGSIDEALQSVHSMTGALRLELHSLNGTSQNIQFRCLIERTETPRQSLAMVQPPLKTRISSLTAFHVTVIMLASVLCTTTACLALMQCCRYSRNWKRLRKGSSSFDNVEYDDLRANATSATSTSELSCQSPVPSTPSVSPEDIMQSSFLFRSRSSLCVSVHPHQAPEEQPKFKWDATKLPLKSALKLRATPLENSGSDTSSPVRRRGRPTVRVAKQQVQRESTTPLTASVSELSITGSEDDFEYDYYDYGCHQEPGSFFCPDPVLTGWPPFIPQPPQGTEEFPLQPFTPSPAPSEIEIPSTDP